MRVGLIVERFESAGGVEQVAWQLAAGLAEAGDEVHVFARRGSPRREVELHTLAVPAWWQPLRVSLFARRAAWGVRRVPLDVVHAFCRAPGHEVFHAGGGSHASYMQRTYGTLGAGARRFSPRHAMQLSLERRVLADPHTQIQCVSGMVAHEMAALGVAAERLHRLPNGVDIERFRPEEDAAARRVTRASIGAGPGTAWLLVGSGWRRKGVDTAMIALAHTKDVDSELWIAGNDDPAPWRERARALGVGERVRFLGARSDPERLYGAADGFVLPSRYDAFGLVVLEAAASGLPVVVSRSTGAAEWIEGGAGIVCDDASDADAFARAFDALAEPAARAGCGEAGRKIAERLAWPRQIQALRSLYARCERRER